MGDFRPSGDHFQVSTIFGTLPRKLESRLSSKGDIARHAFDRLRFGTDTALSDLQSKIEALYRQIVGELTDLKLEEVPELLRLEIGMRGIVYAFGILRGYVSKWEDPDEPWESYAKWFVRQLNRMFDDNWFHQYGDKRDLYLHVVRGSSDNVVNYRFKDIPNAFGALISCVVSSYGARHENIPSADEKQHVFDEFGDDLKGALLKGYKSEARAEYRDQITDIVKLREKVSQVAERRTSRHMKRLFETLGL